MHLTTSYEKDHFLSGVDARVKILVAMIVIVMVLSCEDVSFPAVVTLFCLSLSVPMNIPLRVLALRFAEPIFIVAVILLLKFLFSGHDVLVTFRILGVEVVGYRDGLREGIVIAARMMSAVSLIAILGFSTPFSELMAGLSWFRIPKGFVEVLMFAYRYLFVLFEDASVIYQAQKNRLGYSTIGRGLSSFGTLAGSLTIRAFDHSRKTAVSMMQRGYDGNMPMPAQRSFKTSEIAVSALVLFVMGVLWKII